MIKRLRLFPNGLVTVILKISVAGRRKLFVVN
jgi:hypothetical protein